MISIKKAKATPWNKPVYILPVLTMFIRLNYCSVKHSVGTAVLFQPDIARQEVHRPNVRISIACVRRGCPGLSPAGKEWWNCKCQVPQSHLSVFPSLPSTALIILTDTDSDCICWWVIDVPCLERTSLWCHMVLYTLPGCLLLWRKSTTLMASEGAEVDLAKFQYTESYSVILVSNSKI